MEHKKILPPIDRRSDRELEADALKAQRFIQQRVSKAGFWLSVAVVLIAVLCWLFS